jgi:hypothetical protein
MEIKQYAHWCIMHLGYTFYLSIAIVTIVILIMVWMLRDRRRVGFLRVFRKGRYTDKPLLVHTWTNLCDEEDWAELHLNDGTRGVLLGPARIKILRFDWKPNRTDGDVNLILDYGSLLLHVPKAQKSQQRTLHLPQSVADMEGGRVGAHIGGRGKTEMIFSLCDQYGVAGEARIRDQEGQKLHKELQVFRHDIDKGHKRRSTLFTEELQFIFGKRQALRILDDMVNLR